MKELNYKNESKLLDIKLKELDNETIKTQNELKNERIKL